MNHWAFIGAAYGLTLVTLCSLLGVSWRSMRAAEALAAGLARGR